MTAVVSLSLAITLYAMFIGREGTPWILYVVFGFLIAMTAWQVQTFIRTRMLRKQFEKMKPKRDERSRFLNSSNRRTHPACSMKLILRTSYLRA